MPPKKSIWFRLGYALERTRTTPKAGRLAGLTERIRRGGAPAGTRKRHRGGGSASRTAGLDTDDLLVSGVAALAARALAAWHPRRRAGPLRLLRAAASGAVAALVVELLRPLLEGNPEGTDPSSELAERLVAGAGQGLVYGAVVEPRVPGSALVKGALYASTEYALDPAGGLSRLLGSGTPQGRLPLLARLLEDLAPHDRTYLEHLAFGISLALLYEPGGSSSGMRSEVDAEG